MALRIEGTEVLHIAVPNTSEHHSQCATLLVWHMRPSSYEQQGRLIGSKNDMRFVFKASIYRFLASFHLCRFNRQGELAPPAGASHQHCRALSVIRRLPDLSRVHLSSCFREEVKGLGIPSATQSYRSSRGKKLRAKIPRCNLLGFGAGNFHEVLGRIKHATYRPETQRNCTMPAT